jgi:hypothetical protein
MSGYRTQRSSADQKEKSEWALSCDTPVKGSPVPVSSAMDARVAGGTRRSAALLIKKASTVSGVAMRRVDISGRQRIVYNKNAWSYDGS